MIWLENSIVIYFWIEKREELNGVYFIYVFSRTKFSFGNLWLRACIGIGNQIDKSKSFLKEYHIWHNVCL